jgi:MFS family permease
MSTTSLQTGAQDSDSKKFRFDNSSTINKNVDLAIKQAICWAIMFGIGESSFSLFANHLNAPLSFYAALTWIPAFIGPLIQILSANVLDRYQYRVKLVYLPVIMQALCFAPLIWIALRHEPAGSTSNENSMTFPLYIFLFSVLIYSMSGHFSAPPWQSLVGDFVEPEKRGSFFAKMGRTNSFFSLGSLMLVSFVLYTIEKKYENNYRLISIVFGCFFLISCIARFSSGMLIKKMVDTPYQASESTIFSFWQFIKRAPESNFVKFVIFVAVLHGGANIAGPYFLVYWRDTLHYSQSEWNILQVAGSLSTILTLLIWGRFSDLFGNKKTMKYCAILISLTPFCWLLCDNFYYLIILQMLGMVFWTGFNLSSMNYIYEAASTPKRARCFAYFALIIGTGVLIGTYIGLFVAKIPKDILSPYFHTSFNSSFCWVLLASGIIRGVAWLIFIPTFKELRVVKPFELNSLWADVLHIRTVFGISLIKKPENVLHQNTSENQEK